MTIGLDHFRLLYDVLEATHYIRDEAELAQAVLTRLSQALNAEGGSVFRIKANGSLALLAAYGAPVEALKRAKFEVGKGIVGCVAHYAEPLRVDDAKKDERFMSSVDALTGFDTRSIVAAPVLSRGRPVGVLEFLNRRDGAFTDEDMELVAMAGREIGVAFENISLIRRLEDDRAFHESVLASLSAGVIVIDQNGKVLRLNPSARRILALEAPLPEGERPPLRKLFEKHPRLAEILEGVEHSISPVLRKEFRLEIGGREHLIGYSGVPIMNQDAVRLGSVMLFQDITTTRI